MFDNSLRKIRSVETAVLAGSTKYIDVLEGLDIATSDLEVNSTLEAKKLKVLTSDIGHSLDESYIDVQTAMSRIRNDLTEWTSLSDEFEKASSSADPSKPTDSRLKQQLNDAYVQIMESIDFKTTVHHIVRRTCDSYVKTIVALGDERGISSAARRVAVVVLPFFNPLMSHKFFITTEVSILVFHFCIVKSGLLTIVPWVYVFCRKKHCWEQSAVYGQGNYSIRQIFLFLRSVNYPLRLVSYLPHLAKRPIPFYNLFPRMTALSAQSAQRALAIPHQDRRHNYTAHLGSIRVY